MDPEKVIFGDVVLVPLIVGLLEFIKSFFPDAHCNVWRAGAFVLGVAGQIVAFLIAHGESFAGWGLAVWAVCVVTGLLVGLAAGRAYDASTGKRLDAAVMH